MHNGLSIYQTKYSETTFLALPRIAYIIFNHPVWAKQHYDARIRNKPTIIIELQLNFQKHINICSCVFNKILMKRKILCCKINFNLFLTYNLGVAHGMIAKFCLWTFHKL